MTSSSSSDVDDSSLDPSTLLQAGPKVASRRKTKNRPKKSNDATSSRFNLPKVSKKKDANGLFVLLPNFLDDTNLKDRCLINSMIMHHPYKTPHGTLTDGWLDVVKEAEKSVSDEGERIFAVGELKWRGVKNRFKEYIKYGARDANAAKKRTGCDNEPVPKVLQLLENMCEDYKSYLAQQNHAKLSLGAKQKKDKRC